MRTLHPILSVLATKQHYAKFIFTGLQKHAEAVRVQKDWAAVVQLIALSVTAMKAGTHIYGWIVKNTPRLAEAGVTRGQVRVLETIAEDLLELADDIQFEFSMTPDDPAVQYMLGLSKMEADEEEFFH